MQSFRLDSQIALVTSAYSGLGAAVAVALAEAGADVAVHDGQQCPDQTCARVRRAGRRAVPITGDLADVSEPARLVADVLGAFGRLDILVSHACPPAADAYRENEWDDLIAGRLSSTYRLCRAFGGYLLETKQAGRIINIAAPRDRRQGPGHAAPPRARGSLRPGGAAPAAPPPGPGERRRDAIPDDRWGQPEHVAGAAVFLASPAAAYVNGHVLVVDGGWGVPV